MISIGGSIYVTSHDPLGPLGHVRPTLVLFLSSECENSEMPGELLESRVAQISLTYRVSWVLEEIVLVNL